jgi:ArsR family transcriptional regulator
MPPAEMSASSRAQDGCCPDATAGPGRSEAWAELTARARLFQAVADPARLAIVRQLIEEGQVCGCGFAVGCVLAQPTVSHHLRVLREARLVIAERHGARIFYRANRVELDRLLEPLSLDREDLDGDRLR